jgi:ribosome-associated protein
MIDNACYRARMRDDESRRAVARRERRDAGERSSRVARELMQLKDTTLAKLPIDDDLRDEIVTARKVTSPIARRRAERELAGYLRTVDLDELEAYLINVEATGMADTRLFHAAEKWRARLIEEGSAAAAEFPGGDVEPLTQLIHKAQRERDTGKPPGAARALFRHVMEVLKAQKAGK